MIDPDAFSHQDGEVVPLVWQHNASSPANILGRALLQHRSGEGVYCYASLNGGASAEQTRTALQHGDLNSLSITANHLRQVGDRVEHGYIREVSVVLAGANSGAKIDEILAHGDMYGDEDDFSAIIQSGVELTHEDETDDNIETVADVVASMSDKQRKALDYLLTQAVNGDDTEADKTSHEDNSDESIQHTESETMQRNVFDQGGPEVKTPDYVLTDELMHDMLLSGTSFKKQLLQHADQYGVKNLDMLFPDAKALKDTPEFIKRDTGWVDILWGRLHKTPFSRIKTVFADITKEEARARGYQKGNKKIDEVFELLSRVTTPTTVYKKQRLDRDDILDVTTVDLVRWVFGEMRIMLNEEIARAVLLGDGREALSPDKIKEANVRPIWKDDELYTRRTTLERAATKEEIIDSIITAMDDYEGSGDPLLFCHRSFLTEFLLMRDKMGHRLYNSSAVLADELGVSQIVTVPLMKGVQRDGDSSGKLDLRAIIVNPADYNVGADRGGEITSFEQFDLTYNQQHLLLETRFSGALTRPKSALVIEQKTA